MLINHFILVKNKDMPMMITIPLEIASSNFSLGEYLDKSFHGKRLISVVTSK